MILAFLPQLPIVLLVGISMLFMSLILPSSKFAGYFMLIVWADVPIKLSIFEGTFLTNVDVQCFSPLGAMRIYICTRMPTAHHDVHIYMHAVQISAYRA